MYPRIVRVQNKCRNFLCLILSTHDRHSPLAWCMSCLFFFFFQAEDGIRDRDVTGVQTCALPIYLVNLGVAAFGGPIAAGMMGAASDPDNPLKGALIGGAASYLGGEFMPENPGMRSEERRVGKECRCRW